MQFWLLHSQRNATSCTWGVARSACGLLCSETRYCTLWLCLRREGSTILFQPHSIHHAHVSPSHTTTHNHPLLNPLKHWNLPISFSSLRWNCRQCLLKWVKEFIFSLLTAKVEAQHNMICKQPELPLPVPEVAVINLELHAFHLLPLAFHALIAGPASTMATPSPLLSPGTGLQAVSTTLSSTLYTSSPNHLSLVEQQQPHHSYSTHSLFDQSLPVLSIHHITSLSSSFDRTSHI